MYDYKKKKKKKEMSKIIDSFFVSYFSPVEISYSTPSQSQSTKYSPLTS
jgi:hypothetical protein